MNSDLKSPLEMAHKWESSNPDKIYLNQPINREFVSYTWRETMDQVRRVATYIKAQDFPEGSKIAMMSKNCAHWIMSDLAIWLAGHVSVPLYPNLTADTINQILTHSEAKMIFIGKLDEYESMKPGVPDDVLKVSYPFELYNTDSESLCWNEVLKKNDPLRETDHRDVKDLATIIYTSGTTGVPKGVMHSFHTISFAGTHAVRTVGLDGTTRFFSYLPLSHVAERLLIETGSLYSGGTVFFAESLDTFPEDLKKAKPTIFLAVPRIWNKFKEGILKKLPQEKLDKLLKIPLLNLLIKKKVKVGLGLDECKHLVTGAAAIPATTLRWYKKLGFDIQEAYAMTENFAYSHFTRKNRIKIGSVGQVFPHVDAKIGDNEEIKAKSEATMLGYYKEPQMTAEMMDGEFLKTGDQGEIDSEGYLRITGRVKDLFKTSKGKYVAPAPIELKYEASNLVANICIVGDGLSNPSALLALSEIGQAKPKDAVASEIKSLRTQINEKLDPHENIQKVLVVKEEWTVENGILTPTMKVKRNVVSKKYLSMLEARLSESEDVIWE